MRRGAGEPLQPGDTVVPSTLTGLCEPEGLAQTTALTVLWGTQGQKDTGSGYWRARKGEVGVRDLDLVVRNM